MKKQKIINNDIEAIIEYAKERIEQELREKLEGYVLRSGDTIHVSYDADFDEALCYFKSITKDKEKVMNLDQLEFKLIELQGEMQKERERDNEKKLMLARLERMKEEASYPSIFDDGETMFYSNDRRIRKLCRVWNTREPYWKEVYIYAVIKRKMFGIYKIIGFIDQYDRRWDKAELL